MRHEPLDGSADVYALGMVMYEAYTGIQYFAGVSESEVISKVLHSREHEISFTRPAPAEFVALVAKTIAKSRGQRYRRMADLLKDLEACWPALDETKTVTDLAPIKAEPQPEAVQDELTEQIYEQEKERQRDPVLAEQGQKCEKGEKLKPLAEPKPRRIPILASLAVVSLIAAGLALYLLEPPPKPTPPPALPTPVPESAPTHDIASLEAAAERGEDDAVETLVLRYWDRNQPGDAEKAVAILKRFDDPRALHLLGQCYANGRGIQRDVEEAFNLFDRAARLGDLDAKHDLAVMLMNPPSGVEANPRYAASLFKEGAQAGNVNCMHSYARCLWEGAGIRKDQDGSPKVVP